MNRFTEFKSEIKAINSDVDIRKESSNWHDSIGNINLFYQDKKDEEEFIKVINKYGYKPLMVGLDYKKNMTESQKARYKYQYKTLFNIN